MTKTERVNAVHEDDALALLDLLGVRIAFQTGHLACRVCGAPLKEAGLGAGRRTAGEYEFACERLDCLEEFHRQ